MLESGLPMTRALQTLDDDVARRLAFEIDQGCPLSAALQTLEPVFSPLDVAMVRAGEEGGRLPQILHDLASWQTRERAYLRQFALTLTYPLTAMAVGLMLLLVLGDRILGPMLPLLASRGMPPPLPTRMLALGLHLAPFALIALLAATPGCAASSCASLCWSGSRHPASAMPWPCSTTAACRCSEPWRSPVRIPKSASRCGTAALWRTRWLRWSPPTPIIFWSPAKRRGRLPDMLRRAVQMIDDDVSQKLATAGALLEPLCILGIGLFVGFLVAALIVPMYQAVASL